MTVEGLVVVLFNFGRFLIPIVLVLALYWYLVRFQVDTRDRAALATAGIALGLTLAAQLLLDIRIWATWRSKSTRRSNAFCCNCGLRFY